MRALVVVFLALSLGCSRKADSFAAPSPAAAPAASKADTANQSASAPSPTGPVLLGERISSPAVALADIAKNPKKYENTVVATSGTVTAVCQSMGCWMEIKDDKGEAHVKMHSHAFYVPKTASGHKARVQATVLRTDPNDECAKEAAEQTSKPVAKIELDATGVEID
jgi:hypothetical protein